MLRKYAFTCIILGVTLLAGAIEIKDAYAREVPKNSPNSAAFMQIKNNSNEDIYLQKVLSTGAKTLELHEHIIENGMMKMQQIPHIKIPSHTTIELKSSGLHVMLIGLHKPLIAGESIDMFTLSFSNGEEVKLEHLPIKTVMQAMKH